MAFTIVFFALLWLALVVGLVILSGLGLYRMAQHAGIPAPWRAFVPIANLYVIGLLAERSYYVYNRQVKRLARRSVILVLIPFALLLIFFPFAVTLTGGARGSDAAMLLFLLCWFISIILLLIHQIYCLYYLFRDYAPDNAVLYTVVSTLFNLYFVFLLVERHTVPVSVTGFGAYPYGRPQYDRWHQWNHMPPQQYGPGGYPPWGGGPNTTGPGDYYQGP